VREPGGGERAGKTAAGSGLPFAAEGQGRGRRRGGPQVPPSGALGLQLGPTARARRSRSGQPEMRFGPRTDKHDSGFMRPRLENRCSEKSRNPISQTTRYPAG